MSIPEIPLSSQRLVLPVAFFLFWWGYSIVLHGDFGLVFCDNYTLNTFTYLFAIRAIRVFSFVICLLLGYMLGFFFFFWFGFAFTLLVVKIFHIF